MSSLLRKELKKTLTTTFLKGATLFFIIGIVLLDGKAVFSADRKYTLEEIEERIRSIESALDVIEKYEPKKPAEAVPQEVTPVEPRKVQEIEVKDMEVSIK